MLNGEQSGSAPGGGSATLDRREDERVPLLLAVRVGTATGVVEAAIDNLSAGGAFLRGPLNVATGDVLTIEFAIADESFVMSGRCRRVDPTGAAVAFIEAAPETLLALRMHLASARAGRPIGGSADG